MYTCALCSFFCLLVYLKFITWFTNEHESVQFCIFWGHFSDKCFLFFFLNFFKNMCQEHCKHGFGSKCRFYQVGTSQSFLYTSKTVYALVWFKTRCPPRQTSPKKGPGQIPKSRKQQTNNIQQQQDTIGHLRKIDNDRH